VAIRWRWLAAGAGVFVYIVVNLFIARLWYSPDGGPDWEVWRALPGAIARGEMYATGTESPFVWSPVMGWLMAFVPTMGFWPWVAVHVAALLLIRDWRLVAALAVSAGFLIDSLAGNTFTFVVVAAWWAMRSRSGALVFLALCLLMPRPVQLPLATWLLWHDRSLWRPFAVMFIAHFGVVLWSGYLLDWMNLAAGHMAGGNVGPTAIFGPAWLIVGIPLGAWLTFRGRVGWAGIAVSPYVLLAYWMWPLIEFRRRDRDLSRPS
jgi:hypothetical protein